MSRKLFVAFFLLFFNSSISLAKTEKWVIDESHSKVGFEISHLVISTVEGQFKSFSGDIDFDGDNAKNSSGFGASVNINVDSIDTGNVKRDEHLKSPDFFDVKKFPTMSFKSKTFTVTGKKIEVSGDLTMVGKTKSVLLTGQFLGKVSAYEVNRVAFKAEGVINRKDFDMKWNDLIEAGPVVGEEVTLKLVIEAKRKADL